VNKLEIVEMDYRGEICQKARTNKIKKAARIKSDANCADNKNV
jgi:hypothetical protein